jgi:hypothetical protein
LEIWLEAVSVLRCAIPPKTEVTQNTVLDNYQSNFIEMKPGAMAQAYNPSYSEGSEIGRIAVQGQLGQKFPRPPFSIIDWEWWCTPAISVTWGNTNKRIPVQSCPGRKARTYLKNNESKKGWGHGSNSRAPDWQAQDPEFKPQYHQEKSKNKIKIYRSGIWNLI